MIRVALRVPSSLAGLESDWRDLERRAGASFFQSWTWVGCGIDEFFSDPLLLEARQDERIVGLGLFNRRRGFPEQLWLHQSGDAARDAVFIEHNGIILDRDCAPGTLARCLRAARGRLGGSCLVLSGVDQAHLDAAGPAGGMVTDVRTRPAAFVAFGGPRPFIDSLSANTRYQLRRSERRYGESGPLLVARADTPAQAHDFLDRLAELHQAAWTSRGQPGAFADPGFGRFHHALIDRGFARDEIDLLQITAGESVLGYLYNFRLNGRVSAYQSGFAYPEGDTHRKPGMTCHQHAIQWYAARGAGVYDFLAGESQYKTSLSTDQIDLIWMRLAPSWSPRALVGVIRNRLISR